MLTIAGGIVLGVLGLYALLIVGGGLCFIVGKFLDIVCRPK